MNLAVSGQSVQRRSVRRRGVRRRGIILLLSLTLLTLFLMMLVTLIVITGQYRQSARVQARQDRVGDPPHKLADTALRAIMVGDGVGMSSATGHELLRDVYGSSWRGVVTQVFQSTPAGEPLRDELNKGSTGAFLTFEFRRYEQDGSGFVNLQQDPVTGVRSMSGDHVGCLLTFVGGSPNTTKNVSVRILEFVPPWRQSQAVPDPNPDPTVGRFTIARSNPDDPQGLYDRTTLGDAIAVDDVFVVNERPFSGYGAGYGPNAYLPPTPPDNGQADPAAGYNIAQLEPQKYVYHGAPSAAPFPTVDVPKALAPHYRTYDGFVGTGGFGRADATTGRPTSVEYGGFHEDYDAVDYQNMFLAYVPPDATRADQIVPSFWRPEMVNFWRHYSFDHDGDMGASTPNASLWYHETSVSTHPRMATDPVSIRLRNDFYRRIFLRPLPTDHPEFTGSNPDFALPNDPAAPASLVQRFWQPLSLLTGANDIDGNAQFDTSVTPSVYLSGADDDGSSGMTPWPPMPDERSSPPPFDPVRDVNANGILDQWDVDNDNDGITDSIWIDIGLPAQRLEDGKLYKPLVAFLIRDLDGLSNVNAHHHLDYGNADQQTDVAGPLANTDGLTPINRPRGMGYGPAEIGYPRTGFGVNSGTGFNDPLFTDAQKDNLLIARYGVGDVMPGRPGQKDVTAILRSPTLPPFQYRWDRPSEWGTPPDVWGAQAIGLDYLGQPYNNAVHGSAQLDVHTITRPAPLAPILATEGQDQPYEIDLYAASSAYVDTSLGSRTPDAPFTLAELERVLRWNDSDVSFLPGRLAAAITPAALADIKRRRVITTHTSHIPTMPSSAPSEMRLRPTDSTSGELRKREQWSLYHVMFEKIAATVRANSGNTAFPATNPDLQWVDYEVRKMMPWEMWHGQKFDLNRRWQNGFDDNNNGVVDEPGEVFLPETVFPASQNANFGVGSLSSYDQVFDHLGGAVLHPNGTPYQLSSNEYARQVYARHLYCLALFLMDYDPSGAAATAGFSPADIFDDAEYPAGLVTVQRKDELFKRRLAQWAINVVDARDPDAICTPFEYDLNPYNGWQDDIDGNPGTFNAAAPGDRRIVWGVEAPHLLISETLALHNRRVADTDRDDGDGSIRDDGDTDLDQHRVPQGSLFVELMAVGNRAENDGRVPAELYDLSDGQLMLGKTAPDGAAVWRIAISEPHTENDLNKSAFARRNEIANLRAGVAGAQPQPPTSFEPDDLNLLTLINPSDTTPGTPAPVQLQRFIHFSNSAPTLAGNPATADNTFYWRGGATKVKPGDYVVVAPREDTYFSLMDDDDWSTAPKVIDTASMPNYTAPGLHVDLAAPATARNFNCNDNFQPAMSGDYLHPNAAAHNASLRPIRAMICGADPPAGGWPEAYVGANISEPLPSASNYYPAPDEDPDGDGVIDGYESGTGGMAGMGGIPDVPFDSDASTLNPMAMPPTELPLYEWGVAQGETADQLRTQTMRNWRTAFLQRLANPLMPFHVTNNPYITVDFAPIDITVYNGDDVIPDDWDTMDGDWDEDDDTANNDPANRFQFNGVQLMARERGVGVDRNADDPLNYNPPSNTNLNSDGHFLLWPHAFRAPVNTEPTADGTEGMSAELQFRHNILHTLGYLNVTMGMGVDPMLGIAGPGYTYDPPGTLPDFYGAPPELPAGGGTQRSFPWLNWADRPFATPYELLTVPHSSSAMWFEDWTRDRRTSIATPVEDPYAFQFASTADNTNFRGFYDHLFNFLHGAQHARSSGEPAESPRMYRLFDYVETPSPFVGSREMFHTMGNMDFAPGTLRNGNSYLSRFRDPGRVNMNTMPPHVWDGFEYSHNCVFPDGTTDFDGNSLAFARRGFVGTQTWMYPTRVARPFREAAKADLAPLLPAQGPYVANRLRQYGVEGTLLRSSEIGTSPTTPTNPLFAGPLHGEQFQSTNKNPFFRYEQVSRLPNLTTTQSNVYAVWMTVGYFEAYRESPAVRNPAIAGVYQGQPLPDGVWLGPELGTDTGNNRRHRAFYIIDRSIPVAFEPGNEHNFEKTILVRRYLD